MSNKNFITVTSDKVKSKALFWWFVGIFGMFGLHNFYVGRVGRGILFMFTAGLVGFGGFVDLIAILTGSFKDNVGAPLRK